MTHSVLKHTRGKRGVGGVEDRAMDRWRVRDQAECIQQIVMKQDM